MWNLNKSYAEQKRVRTGEKVIKPNEDLPVRNNLNNWNYGRTIVDVMFWNSFYRDGVLYHIIVRRGDFQLNHCKRFIGRTMRLIVNIKFRTFNIRTLKLNSSENNLCWCFYRRFPWRWNTTRWNCILTCFACIYVVQPKLFRFRP